MPQPAEVSVTAAAGRNAKLRRIVQLLSVASADLKRVQQHAVVGDEELWKVYWWGSHRDEALVQALRIEPTLISHVRNDESERRVVSRGFMEAAKDVESDWLCEFKELPADALERYGPLDSRRFVDPPDDGVERLRFRELYEGPRLLIGRGVRQKDGLNGKIVARFETQPLCFRHSIYGVRLIGNIEDEAKVFLGILFNRNYITNGVARFEKPEWGYGADCPSGVMIGFIQSMDLDTIRNEVNGFGQQEGYSPITNDTNDPSIQPVRLRQRLNRRTIPPQFTLQHLWIDLRVG